ncbi:hypothetical protein SAZ11_14245 [Streptomyces sp. FXJ1.4098]|nr:hypothetical protein [Streptomyces sp. FXJ1.4098]
MRHVLGGRRHGDGGQRGDGGEHGLGPAAGRFGEGLHAEDGQQDDGQVDEAGLAVRGHPQHDEGEHRGHAEKHAVPVAGPRSRRPRTPVAAPPPDRGAQAPQPRGHDDAAEVAGQPVREDGQVVHETVAHIGPPGVLGRGEDQAEGAAGDLGGVAEVRYQPGDQDARAQGQSTPLGQPGPGP